MFGGWKFFFVFRGSSLVMFPEFSKGFYGFWFCWRVGFGWFFVAFRVTFVMWKSHGVSRTFEAAAGE